MSKEEIIKDQAVKNRTYGTGEFKFDLNDAKEMLEKMESQYKAKVDELEKERNHYRAMFGEDERLLEERSISIQAIEQVEELQSELTSLKQEKERMVDLLFSARLQLEYLNNKFPETGTTNAVLSQIKSELDKQNK